MGLAEYPRFGAYHRGLSQAGYPRAGVAHALRPDRLPASAACYARDEPTFVDALASVRRAF